ncbi:ubiquitin-like-conjugating enzyme ATG10 [Quillaja saponaria]|uniref:Ubiquitin-like-conjugating enzyme ATG10 n=1 Tax=Quillaja saponaria TaxID=32244 RepID=A0AAD7L2Y4_QUISA|nr:ubiquitin-like-conjugating enzyme ATG10 [Quillaja saponaria]
MATKEAIEDLFSWDGTLSSSDFYLAACAFAKKWKIYNPTVPQWLWLPCSKNDWVSSHMVDGYLSMENMFFLSSSEEEHVEGSKTRKEPESSEKEEPFDHATLVQNDFHEVHHYDFHIVYSASYRVPVLYFRAYHNDGQPLMFHEIEKDLPAQSAKILLESKWTFITQEEHPYLNRPWYKLHPCGTK